MNVGTHIKKLETTLKEREKCNLLLEIGQFAKDIKSLIIKKIFCHRNKAPCKTLEQIDALAQKVCIVYYSVVNKK